MELLKILFLLFVALAVVVMATERFGKPMSREKQSKLSKIAIILVLVMLVARIIKEIA